MHPRILSITFHAAPEFERIWFDAGTPPWDRADLRTALRDLVEHVDPRETLYIVPEQSQLLEFVHRSPTSGHQYGMLLLDMGHVAQRLEAAR
jgi:hypothetical protein